MNKPKLIIFASGEKEPGKGGSGFKNLVLATRNGTLNADIVGVVSNHANGGVADKARELGIKFIHMQKPFTGEKYEEIVRESGAEWVSLSGWLKLVVVRDLSWKGKILNFFGKNHGLDPRRTFNIHPGPLPKYGGPGMYGHFVHEAVVADHITDQSVYGAVTMHFVTKKYDDGPVFFRIAVEVLDEDDAKTLGSRVNEVEHKWQPIITNSVILGNISWDGIHKKSLKGAVLKY